MSIIICQIDLDTNNYVHTLKRGVPVNTLEPSLKFYSSLTVVTQFDSLYWQLRGTAHGHAKSTIKLQCSFST